MTSPFFQPLSVEVSGLKWEESPYGHQAPPEIRVYEIINGTAGNNQVRNTGSDSETIFERNRQTRNLIFLTARKGRMHGREEGSWGLARRVEEAVPLLPNDGTVHDFYLSICMFPVPPL